MLAIGERFGVPPEERKNVVQVCKNAPLVRFQDV
jgi:hypothetical protein